MNTTLKVGSSCGLGALFGTLIALLFNPWLWWIGALAGGVVAYVVYDLKQIVQAVPVAWDGAVAVWKQLPSALAKWSTFMESYAYMMTVVAGAVFTLILGVYGLSSLFDSNSITPTHSALLLALTIFLSSFMGLTLTLGLWENETELSRIELRRKQRALAIRFNPVTAPFIAAYITLRGIYWCIKRTPKACKTACDSCMLAIRGVGVFFWKLFILVHSEMRALCFIDAFFGATVGTIYGHYEHVFALAAIIGAISGALLGIVNYQIVSIRWLKLKPA